MQKVSNVRRIFFCLLMIMLMVSTFSVIGAADEISEQAGVATLSGEIADGAESDVADSEESDYTGIKAIAAAIAISIGAASGAIAMGIAISKSSQSIARQPEAGENIRASLLLGLVFIETAIIYALVVAIMIIFVL